MHVVHLSVWNGWSQDLSLSRLHLRLGSGGKGISLEIPAYLRPSEGGQILFLISVPMVAAFEYIRACYSLRVCYLANLLLCFPTHYTYPEIIQTALHICRVLLFQCNYAKPEIL